MTELLGQEWYTDIGLDGGGGGGGGGHHPKFYY